MVSRCFPGGYNVKLYISRGRLAWWLLAFLHSVRGFRAHNHILISNKPCCNFIFDELILTDQLYLPISFVKQFPPSFISWSIYPTSWSILNGFIWGNIRGFFRGFLLILGQSAALFVHPSITKELHFEKNSLNSQMIEGNSQMFFSFVYRHQPELKFRHSCCYRQSKINN